MRILFSAWLMVLILYTAACDKNSEGTVVPGQKLYVADHVVDCEGVFPQKCLLVRESPGDEWTYFYDGITGFTYEPGYSYTLLIKEKRIKNPPADASGIQYSLIKVLQKLKTR